MNYNRRTKAEELISSAWLNENRVSQRYYATLKPKLDQEIP